MTNLRGVYLIRTSFAFFSYHSIVSNSSSSTRQYRIKRWSVEAAKELIDIPSQVWLRAFLRHTRQQKVHRFLHISPGHRHWRFLVINPLIILVCHVLCRQDLSQDLLIGEVLNDGQSAVYFIGNLKRSLWRRHCAVGFLLRGLKYY